MRKESRARMRFDWFGIKGRNGLPARGPRWFVTRGANWLYVSFGGVCSVTLPWFWSNAALWSRGYDQGWNAGFSAGMSRASRSERVAG